MYNDLLEQLKDHDAKLVAVSKTKPVGDILALYEKGQRDFGENRASELAEKQQQLPRDIRWHMIGHLQRNKVSTILEFTHLIHSIDSARLYKEIVKQARKSNIKIDGLLQIKIAEEESKYGIDPNGINEFLTEINQKPAKDLRICGVMGMASFVEDEQQIRREFRQLATLFAEIKSRHFAEDSHFREISMGMSGDYKIALEEGSTMVRIGSLLFGAREYI